MEGIAIQGLGGLGIGINRLSVCPIKSFLGLKTQLPLFLAVVL
jgi:hypothetical protein